MHSSAHVLCIDTFPHKFNMRLVRGFQFALPPPFYSKRNTLFFKCRNFFHSCRSSRAIASPPISAFDDLCSRALQGLFSFFFISAQRIETQIRKRRKDRWKRKRINTGKKYACEKLNIVVFSYASGYFFDIDDSIRRDSLVLFASRFLIRVCHAYVRLNASFLYPEQARVLPSKSVLLIETTCMQK